MEHLNRRAFALLTAGMVASPGLAAALPSFLAAAIDSPMRSARNVARDRYRHPLETLRFFGLRPTQTVVEIEPGGGYWTEILAPYLKPAGRYIAALPPPSAGGEAARGWAAFLAKVNAAPEFFAGVMVTGLGAGPMAPAGGADLVLSFRNLHDWMADGTAAQKLGLIRATLKPGGVFGIEDHRGRPDRPQDPRAGSGYVRQDYATRLITAAGFRLVGSAAVGDNPRDTKDYPKGVWTLPPTLAMGATDRAKYLAIGESDRWTMKFVRV
jgi:predicted methyltransferase